jgi:hypothetical protein
MSEASFYRDKEFNGLIEPLELKPHIKHLGMVALLEYEGDMYFDPMGEYEKSNN